MVDYPFDILMFVDQINGILSQCGSQAIHFRVAVRVPAYDAVHQPEPELHMIECWDGVDMYVVDTYHLDMYSGDYDPLACIAGYVRYVMREQGFQRWEASLPARQCFDHSYFNDDETDYLYWQRSIWRWLSHVRIELGLREGSEKIDHFLGSLKRSINRLHNCK